MADKLLLTSDNPPHKPAHQSVIHSDELYELRKKILNSIIDEAGTLIDVQSAINRSFRSTTCPLAALALEEASLYQMTKK